LDATGTVSAIHQDFAMMAGNRVELLGQLGETDIEAKARSEPVEGGGD